MKLEKTWPIQLTNSTWEVIKSAKDYFSRKDINILLWQTKASSPIGNDRSPCQQWRACNSKVNSAMWLSFQIMKYFIYVLFICKFHKDWIKITQAPLRTKSNMFLFWHARASNSKVNKAILPELQPIRDFKPVQVICNFQKDPIKTK